MKYKIINLNFDRWQRMTLRNELGGMVEVLWNNGLPFISGALTIIHHPYWILLFALPAIFTLTIPTTQEIENEKNNQM